MCECVCMNVLEYSLFAQKINSPLLSERGVILQCQCMEATVWRVGRWRVGGVESVGGEGESSDVEEGCQNKLLLEQFLLMG